MASLLDGWLPGDAIDLIDDASVALLREAVRHEGAAAGLGDQACAELVAAASELGRNQLRHGRAARALAHRVERGAVAGVEVIAADLGPGIADPEAALRGEPRASGSLGVGLSAAYRLCDEMDFDVRLGEGTCIWARKFSSAVERSEVAVFGRHLATERLSGDQAVFVRGGELLVAGVIDGLGHGPPAREAADAAAQAIRAGWQQPPDQILRDADRALAGTRGAVIAVARMELGRREVSCASVGNIGVHLVPRGPTRRFAAANGILGARPSVGRIPVETAPLPARTPLLLFSDGLSSRLDVSEESELLRQPPLVIAKRLVERFGRDHDDALILVAR